MSACGVDVEPQGPESINSELNLGLKGQLPPERDCRLVSVRPTASGTLRMAPQMDMLEVAPVGSTVQSMFFDTTMYGPEHRHGIVEFDLPALGGRLVSATLKFNDRHGWQLQAVPSDLHKLSLYSADGVVDTADWVREGSPFTTFATDLNDMNPQERSFDLAGQVRLGARLGARLELLRGSLPNGSYGSGFDGFRIDVKVCGEAALPDGVPTGDPL
jgi:hypothetical protein